jgi:anthranilate/para-aminobenzoate synthase component II
MILMIDNYDSFTYNLVQYLGELGAEVKVVRNDEISLADIEALDPERIVISPGPCSPNEAGSRFLACASGIRRSARRSVARSCMPRH